MNLMVGDRAVETYEIELDVSAAVPQADRCVVGCSIFLPPAPGPGPTVVVALPGGSYNRRYWDMAPPGREVLSQARYFAQRGVGFCAVDYIGAAQESRPADGDVMTMDVAADAAHLAFQQLRDKFLSGAFGRAPLDEPTFVGMGQSMGGSMTIVQQGGHHDYAAIAPLGTSDSASKLLSFSGDALARWPELSTQERREVARSWLESVLGELPMYHETSRALFSDAFFGPDPDPELVAYDEATLQTMIPRSLSIDTATPAFLDPYIAAIECPVFLGFGDIEAKAREAHAQPARYQASTDITLCVFPQMAHMHNHAPTRQLLWDRLLLWLETVTAESRTP